MNFEQPDELLDRWFNSAAWAQIQDESHQGCQESLKLMENINEQLGSLIFHLQKDPTGDRILYELKYFAELCDDFNVA
jgi:hypothetical protein